MPEQKRNSVRARRICWDTHRKRNDLTGRDGMTCHICGIWLDPVRDKWRADHIARHAEGGKETPENLWPICLPCDTGTDGKAANDTHEVAKGKRTAEKHYGVREKRGRPMPGSKASKYRKRMDGTVEVRR